MDRFGFTKDELVQMFQTTWNAENPGQAAGDESLAVVAALAEVIEHNNKKIEKDVARTLTQYARGY